MSLKQLKDLQKKSEEEWRISKMVIIAIIVGLLLLQQLIEALINIADEGL